MRHLTEEQLIGLVLGRGPGREHLAVCPECRAKCNEIRQLTALLQESQATPPVSAWSRLKRRTDRSRPPERDWAEPRWLPLVGVHLGAVLAGFVLIFALGGWLEGSSLWEWLARLPFMRAIGPRGLVGVAFLIGGGLFVLALTPILSWKLRSPLGAQASCLHRGRRHPACSD